MKCHYEVLNVERDAEEGAIKTAYRKAALRWHPDKNLDDPDTAKAQFQIVQQAYEVLSDPQERAWYDRHREQILMGGGSEYEDNALSVFQYFTASCYSGFGDDEKGFYTVFRNVFDQLASEEIEHLDSPEEYELIPKFGDSQSNFEEVVQPFYAYWQSFCTKKSYAWLSTHNITEIRDRRILKVVEKENKKVQQKARKERNEEIRGLVSFVRKRDKRVQAHRKVLEEKAAENRRRQAQLDLELALKRKQEVAEQLKNRSNAHDDGYEEQLRQLEKAMQLSGDEDSEGDAEDDDLLASKLEDVHIDLDDLEEGIANDCEFFCVACNKTFKNKSSFRNHESSKKHKENVELIKQEMLEEEDMLQSSEEEEEEDVDDDVDEKDEEEGELLEAEEPEKDVDIIEPQEVIIEQSSGKNKKKKKQHQQQKKVVEDSEEEEEMGNMFLKADSDADDDDWGASGSKGKGSSKSKAKASAPVAKKGKKNKEKPEVSVKVESKANLNEDSGDDDPSAADPVDLDHKCVTCFLQFSSKNKLFQHLKKTNHGVYIPKGKQVTTANVGELRKGKKK